MLGAIVGDVHGSSYEFNPTKDYAHALMPESSCWTDDTLLTVAVGVAVLDGLDLAATLRDFSSRFVTSYGPAYWSWVTGPASAGPYGSWGNGASMRVSPAAWLGLDVADVARLSAWSCAPTHDHPEALRGALATAVAARMALEGFPQGDVRDFVGRLSGYDLSRPVEAIRPGCAFEVKSWISVPEALTCALSASSFEDAIRSAVSLGGDADTQAAIAGAVAEGWFGVPEDLARRARATLPEGVDADLSRLLAARPAAFARGPARLYDALPRWDPGSVARFDARFDGAREARAAALEAEFAAEHRRVDALIEREATAREASAVPARDRRGPLARLLAGLGRRR